MFELSIKWEFFMILNVGCPVPCKKGGPEAPDNAQETASLWSPLLGLCKGAEVGESGLVERLCACSIELWVRIF